LDGRQPFLTQKVCNLVRETNQEIPPEEATVFVENLVRSCVINHWESQDEPEHFRTIRDRLLQRDELRAVYLLDLYQKIWEAGTRETDNSREQSDLQLSGIIVKKDNRLEVYNRIYGAVFDKGWIEKTLASLRPYAESFRKWLASGKQDDSLLLRGNTLAEAESWAKR
jgi:hypothetical protein